MNRIITIATFLAVCALQISSAQAQTVIVPANPVWTDTGLTVSETDILSLNNATGSWTVLLGSWPFVGPEGYNRPGYESDEWIMNGHHAQLIGFIGDPGINPNVFPRVVTQNDPRLFEIGTNSVKVTNKSGKLWLGINDAWATGGGTGVSDNSGSVVVQVNVQKAIAATIEVSSVDICWDSETNRTYQVQYKSTLTADSWTNLGVPALGTGGKTSVTDSVRNTEKRFYRIVDSQAQ